MKTSDLNNPYRSVPNRIGSVKGGTFVFNKPTPPSKKGYVRETFSETFEEEEGPDNNHIEIVIEFDPINFLILVSALTFFEIFLDYFSK
jgi:hypothetical protein